MLNANEQPNTVSCYPKHKIEIILGIVFFIILIILTTISFVYKSYLTKDEFGLFYTSCGYIVFNCTAIVVLLDSIRENKDLRCYICYVVVLIVNVVLVTMSFILFFQNYHMLVLIPLIYNSAILLGIIGGLIAYFIKKRSQNSHFIQI